MRQTHSPHPGCKQPEPHSPSAATLFLPFSSSHSTPHTNHPPLHRAKSHLPAWLKPLCDLGPSSYSSIKYQSTRPVVLTTTSTNPYSQLEAHLTNPTHELHPCLLHLKTLGNVAQLKRQQRLPHAPHPTKPTHAPPQSPCPSSPLHPT